MQDYLNERIRGVVKDCWDRRDPSGGIADPLLGTGHQGWEVLECRTHQNKSFWENIHFGKVVVWYGVYWMNIHF